MPELELMLTHRLGDGAAVFVDSATHEFYVMHSTEDTLHHYDNSKDRRIRMQIDCEKPIPDKEVTFPDLSTATKYVRALAMFDRMVEYIIIVYKDRKLNKSDRAEADAGLQEIRDEIRKEEYMSILQTVPQYRDILNYLDMSPEEIIFELRAK